MVAGKGKGCFINIDDSLVQYTFKEKAQLQVFIVQLAAESAGEPGIGIPEKDPVVFRNPAVSSGNNLAIFTDSVEVREFRIFGSAANLLTFTRYSGINPDVWATDADYNLMPFSRVFTIGVNASF